mgnify:CR=1 FL=1
MDIILEIFMYRITQIEGGSTGHINKKNQVYESGQ